MLKSIRIYRDSEDGATAIEYGLIAAGVALAISAVVFRFGDEFVNLFQIISDYLTQRL